MKMTSSYVSGNILQKSHFYIQSLKSEVFFELSSQFTLQDLPQNIKGSTILKLWNTLEYGSIGGREWNHRRIKDHTFFYGKNKKLP